MVITQSRIYLVELNSAVEFVHESKLNVLRLFLLPLWESVIVLCFVVRYFMSILVLQSS